MPYFQVLYCVFWVSTQYFSTIDTGGTNCICIPLRCKCG